MVVFEIKNDTLHQNIWYDITISNDYFIRYENRFYKVHQSMMGNYPGK